MLPQMSTMPRSRWRGSASPPFSLTILLLGVFASLSPQTRADDQISCMVDPKLGYNVPKNVYQCKRPLKCCFEYSKPACCGSKPFWQILKEQLALWGGLFAILFTLASIVYCRKNDVNLPACVAVKNCLIRCCCGTNSDADSEHDMTLKLAEVGRADKLSTKHGWRHNSVNPMPNSMLVQTSHV